MGPWGPESMASAPRYGPNLPRTCSTTVPLGLRKCIAVGGAFSIYAPRGIRRLRAPHSFTPAAMRLPPGAARGRPPDLLPSAPASENFILAQVVAPFGAGVGYWWSRCVFSLRTCAAKRAPMRYCGAGHRLKVLPAPKYCDTCANKSSND